MKALHWLILGSSSVVLAACQVPEGQSRPAVTTVADTTGAGYFFPQPTSSEIKETTPLFVDGVGSGQRQFLVDQINLLASAQSAELSFVLQATGDDNDTLVFTLFGTRGELSEYRARALMARTTSTVRSAPMVVQLGLEEQVDFFDVAAAMGFQRIIVSDGLRTAHAFVLEPRNQ